MNRPSVLPFVACKTPEKTVYCVFCSISVTSITIMETPKYLKTSSEQLKNKSKPNDRLLMNL